MLLLPQARYLNHHIYLPLDRFWKLTSELDQKCKQCYQIVKHFR